MKYRKKPVVIDAIQWTGDNVAEVLSFLEGDVVGELASGTLIRISTLEGIMECPVGHWIIRGIKGEHYSCEASIFGLTYESVEASA